MRKIILLNFLVFSLVACNTSNKPTDDKIVDALQDSIAFAQSHTAQNSLDYAGAYEGVLPCADCEGIKTKLILNKDNSYVLELIYLKGGDNLPVEELKGNFVWNEAGNTVTLEGLKEFNSQYFVGEGRLFVLDMNGERIETALKDHYILEQTEVF